MKKTINGRKVKLIDDRNPELEKGCGGCVFNVGRSCKLIGNWSCVDLGMKNSGSHYIWVDDNEELQKPN